MANDVRRVGFGRSAIGAIFLVFVAMAAAPAADKDNRTAGTTDAGRADQDFALQGEFEGKIPDADHKDRTVALQIRANGRGRFQALQFDGGLPGQTRHPHHPLFLLGKRSDDFLVLSGAPWGIFVHPDRCLLVDPQGKPVGQLERVHRESPTLGARPPKQATILFDGVTNRFAESHITDQGLLAEGASVIPMFQDFDLHLEFKLPYMPSNSGQSRANSGVYLQSRYEVQILDSFALSTTFNGCGSLYRSRKPDVNMCLPPLVWQTYDISFTAPRWAADNTKLKNARITVWLNGVKVQDSVEIPDKTGAGAVEEVVLLPIRLQDHGAPVRFQNIWIVDRGADGWVKFPVISSEEDKARARESLGAPCPPAMSKPKAPEKPAPAKPAPKPAEKPAAKPAAAPEKPAAKPAEKPAPEKPAPEKPAATPKPADKPADKPAPSKPAAEKPADKPADKPAPAKKS